jgi:biopolymer transport protein ExbB/TolQ
LIILYIIIGGLKKMDIPTIPNQMFLLIIAIIAAIVLIIIVLQWKSISQSKNSIAILEKEIELKKMSMVEKDIESKRLMDNPIPLPQDQQDRLSEIRQSTTEARSRVGFLHSEINERLARLEAETEQRKLEKMLTEIEEKEKKLKGMK